MMHKTILFRGSRERLRRMVERCGGRFSGTDSFLIPWKPDHYKQHHVLAFRIRCRCQKTESGYWITYRILPTPFSMIRIGFPIIVLLWVLLEYFPGSNAVEYGAMGIFIGFLLLTAWWQLRDSEREFRARFETPAR